MDILVPGPADFPWGPDQNKNQFYPEWGGSSRSHRLGPGSAWLKTPKDPDLLNINTKMQLQYELLLAHGSLSVESSPLVCY